MLGRVRALSLNRISVSCSYSIKSRQTDPNAVLAEVNEVLRAVYDHDAFDSFYLHLWKENKCIDNLSHNDFASRLLQLLDVRAGDSATIVSDHQNNSLDYRAFDREQALKLINATPID